MTRQQTEPIPENLRCKCGGKKESPNHPVCYACHLNGYIPKWYMKAERYSYPNVRSGSLSVATRHPKTGKDILDCPSGQRISLKMLTR